MRSRTWLGRGVDGGGQSGADRSMPGEISDQFFHGAPAGSRCRAFGFRIQSGSGLDPSSSFAVISVMALAGPSSNLQANRGSTRKSTVSVHVHLELILNAFCGRISSRDIAEAGGTGFVTSLSLSTVVICCDCDMYFTGKRARR